MIEETYNQIEADKSSVHPSEPFFFVDKAETTEYTAVPLWDHPCHVCLTFKSSFNCHKRVDKQIS